MIATFSDGFNGRRIHSTLNNKDYICRGLWLHETQHEHKVEIKSFVVAEEMGGTLVHLPMNDIRFLAGPE